MFKKSHQDTASVANNLKDCHSFLSIHPRYLYNIMSTDGGYNIKHIL